MIDKLSAIAAGGIVVFFIGAMLVDSYAKLRQTRARDK